MQKAALHSNSARNRSRNTHGPNTPHLRVLLRGEAVHERYALRCVNAFLCAITATGVSRQTLVKFDVGVDHLPPDRLPLHTIHVQMLYFRERDLGVIVG
jgi:hypothetical protein